MIALGVGVLIIILLLLARPGLPQRPQGARLRELRLGPELDRDPVEPALERVLRPARGPAERTPTSSASRPRSPPTAAPPRACCSGSRASTRPDELSRRPDRARAGVRAAPRRARRDRRRDPDRARQRGAQRGDRPDRRRHARLPRQRRALRPGPRPRSTSVLADQGVSGKVPDSVFLPEPDRPLARPPAADHDPEHLRGRRRRDRRASTASRCCQHDDRQDPRSPPTPRTRSRSAAARPRSTVEVQNQGDTEESDVAVSYSSRGGAVPLEGEGTIAKLDAQGIETIDARAPGRRRTPTCR